MYSGNCGPGTFVTIRLNRRVEKFSRDACASSSRRREALGARDRGGADRHLALLELAHRLAHDTQSRDRVVDVDGERSSHRDDLVPELAAGVGGAHRHGDEGAQLQSLGAHAA